MSVYLPLHVLQERLLYVLDCMIEGWELELDNMKGEFFCCKFRLPFSLSSIGHFVHPVGREGMD